MRIITGFSTALLAVAALIWIQTPLLLCLVIGFSVIAAHEICHAVHMKNKAMIAVSMVAAAVFPVALTYWNTLPDRVQIAGYPILIGYIILLVLLMLSQYEKTTFSDILYAAYASLAIPGGLATMPIMRNSIEAYDGDAYEKNLVIWFIFFVMCCAWMTDVMAYFVGVKLGKHKLCPKISPKKTIEGAVGGLFFMVLINVGFALMFNAFFLESHKINLITVALISVPIGIVSMIGDLTASVLKRNHGVKDFGKIFPGHGGVMDRFDSMVFVAPFVFALLQLDQAIGLHLFYR